MKKTVLSFYFFSLSLSSFSQTLGLLTHDPSSLDGYVLFAPIISNNTYLIDKCGKLVHSWTSTHRPGQSVYLLEDGNLLRPGSTGNAVFTSGGNGGIIEKFDWNSNLLWSYTISSTTECQHHDIRQLPNGNVLAIVWELKTTGEATASGRNPSLLGTSLWSEKIIELQPVGTNSANIVWEWHVWDHLVQEFDITKLNYSTVSQHPELINLNYTSGPATATDWLHCNSVDYNPSLDQIIISSHNFNEVWIIDHSTTTAEAASHSGGTSGKGGDLLYRWGNAAAYSRGNMTNKKLFGQHNAHWIENGMRDAGKIMIFNNGQGRSTGNYSSVDIINPPVDGFGNYALTGSQPYQPDSAEWSYVAQVPTDFYSANISGAQRLSNGNTLICEGPQGRFFEIDTLKNTVWKYVNPVAQSGILSQGATASQNLVFRCSLYEPSFPGFTGLTLTPGSPIEINPLPYNCDMITGINDLYDADNIQILVSSPFSNEIRITSNADIYEADIQLYDITGRDIASYSDITILKKEPLSLKVKRNLQPGIYFLNLRTSTLNLTAKIIQPF